MLSHEEITSTAKDILDRIGVGDPFVADGELIARSPVTGGELGRLRAHTPQQVAELVGNAAEAFGQWRDVPAPVRGGLVRELGELLREHKADLGALVSLEAGKITSEGLGGCRR
jgi:aldehyde dehydrogenase (NAD+)